MHDRFIALADAWLRAPSDRHRAQALIQEIRSVRDAHNPHGAYDAYDPPNVDVCPHVESEISIEKMRDVYTLELVRGKRRWSTSGGLGARLEKAIATMRSCGWSVDRKYVGRRVVGVVRCSDCA